MLLSFVLCVRRGMRIFAIIGAGVAVLTACGGISGYYDDPEKPTASTAKACKMASFAALNFGGFARITSAEPVTSGDYTPTTPLGVSGAVQQNLPGFCVVKGVATPSSDSEINFEVWVPDTWNGKLVATGNGGYSPALSYTDMAYALRQGYATLGGDTGHQPNDDLIFGVNHKEKIFDWGTRSINAITTPSKRIVATLKGQDAKRSYYIGCSTGGHQAFAEVQRYPTDFDGVIAAAPGSNRTASSMEFMWRFLSNRPQGINDVSSAILTQNSLQLLSDKAVAACDAIDGVKDGVLNEPRECKFDINTLACSGDVAAPTCLTQAQIAAAKKIYDGPKRPNGTQIYPGWVFGSETQWWSYMSGSAPARSDFWALWVFGNPHWDWWTFDYDRDVDYAYKIIAPLVDQTSTDISAFKSNGGKMIVYHGWNDGIVNPIDSIKYYEDVKARIGSQAEMDSFYRLLLIPGMGHCTGGDGNIAGVIRMENPEAGMQIDPDRDILSALDKWVEDGRVPNLTGSNNMGTVTRPMCFYPKRIVYNGNGDTTKAENYQCR